MNKCREKRLKKEMEIYRTFKNNYMPNIFYYENLNEIKYLNVILKIPEKYPFEPPVYSYENKNPYKIVKPGNIRALLFCGDLLNVAPINLLDPKCCVHCSSLLCSSNYNISMTLTSFFVESILLYKYMILTSTLHLRYVNKLLERFPDDIICCIIQNC